MQDARFFTFLTVVGVICLPMVLGRMSTTSQPTAADWDQLERSEPLVTVVGYRDHDAQPARRQVFTEDPSDLNRPASAGKLVPIPDAPASGIGK